MNKTAPTAIVTERIKSELSAAFPNVKFSVKQRPGSSQAITVNWQDGPTTKEVRLVIDGVECSAMYIFANREWSGETQARLMGWAHEYYDLGPTAQPWDYEAMAWRKFCQA